VGDGALLRLRRMWSLFFKSERRGELGGVGPKLKGMQFSTWCL